MGAKSGTVVIKGVQRSATAALTAMLRASPETLGSTGAGFQSLFPCMLYALAPLRETSL